MAPTLASQLTISASAYLFNGILKLCSKSVNVEGLPILLDALKEGTGNGKGKGRAIDVEVNEQQPRRRGVVTGTRYDLLVQLIDLGQYAIIIPSWMIQPCVPFSPEYNHR